MRRTRWRVTLAVTLALAIGGATLAAARPKPDSSRSGTPDIDLKHVQVHRVGRKMHVEGDMSVNGERVRFDDTVQVAIPHIRVQRTPHIEVGPGIHIESDDESVVRMGSDIVIDSTEFVEDAVVALFGNVTVRGRVGGDVVAVLGSVKLEPGSVVEGDAVAVGGSLDQDNEANVRGQSVSLSFLPIHTPDIPPLRALAIMLFIAWLVAMLVGALLGLLFRKRLVRVAEAVAERTGWSLLFGLLLPPIGVIAAVLLVVTLIGIPVAAVLPLVYLFMLWAGTVAATYLLGCRASGRELGSSLGLPLLVGTLIVGVLFAVGAAIPSRGALGSFTLFFPLLGVLLATSLSVIGSGALLVSRFGSEPRPETTPLNATSAPPPEAMPPLAGPPPGTAPASSG